MYTYVGTYITESDSYTRVESFNNQIYYDVLDKST